jgi:hypothetical protein
MAERKDEGSSEAAIRVLYFYGDDKIKCREWSLKTLAIGNIKKWKPALLNDYKIAALTEQIVLTKEEQVKVHTNQLAWTYLILVSMMRSRIKRGFTSKNYSHRTRRLIWL